MPRESGFTLIELMVTLAVAAILITVAVPGFANLIAEQRVVTTTNRFVTALHLTRSEAVKRGARVTLCASGDGSTCGSAGDYSDGWIVFVGPAFGEPLNPPGEILRVFPAGPLDVEGNGSMASYISYVATGETRQLGGALQMGTVTICDEDRGRNVIISRTGRPRVEPSVC
ncbi:prepilin-type N-terminal cleavage/methylation domain-containing protein [Thioalkalivibrio denitrificans]|uniref:Type II secretion system protein H n=1 Tax=Thioalkalivibrio denitrificans TaxID=108003 RepID=A0A1V3NJ45_9GAMM|nr:GspH/FimT family pseudopilin [Thioalkalivibrio denitrificans]OOG24908.1 prepilin-type N-terminal cleavage/methylation domain-containing protein [Thioalkalivibrio denitrificans]